jgi:phosphonate transport system permease protein
LRGIDAHVERFIAEFELKPTGIPDEPAEDCGVKWGLAILAFTAYAAWQLGLPLGGLGPGVLKLFGIAGQMLPPETGGQLGVFVYSLVETVAMALAATVLAGIAAFPLGLLGARRVVPSLFARWPLRRGMDVARSIDSLLWALLFVNAVGLGPFAGVMALTMIDLGTLAKLLSETVDHASNGPVEGLEAAGANRWESVRFGLLPQVLPAYTSQVLYYFESNIRHATILGLVGAGGIGTHLSDRLRVNDWREVATLVLLILVTVTVVDRCSRWARLRLERGV